MLRFLLIISLVASLPRPTAREPRRDALHDFRNRTFETALRVSDVVRLRFALAGAATRCRNVENLFGYNLLVDQFAGRPKAVIEAAAREGMDSGLRRAPAAADRAFCSVALRSLGSADDELVVLSEHVAHQDMPAAP